MQIYLQIFSGLANSGTEDVEGLAIASDEEMAGMENEPTSISSLKGRGVYFFNACGIFVRNAVEAPDGEIMAIGGKAALGVGFVLVGISRCLADKTVGRSGDSGGAVLGKSKSPISGAIQQAAAFEIAAGEVEQIEIVLPADKELVPYRPKRPYILLGARKTRCLPVGGSRQRRGSRHGKNGAVALENESVACFHTIDTREEKRIGLGCHQCAYGEENGQHRKQDAFHRMEC